MAVSDTLIDTLFDGRYRIVRKLGSGGMANVYLAEDQELGRRVAIKILNDRHAGDEQFVERFRREAKNAAGLSHPNIVSIYDRGEAEGTYYIAMEYLDGRSLKELIVSRGPAPSRSRDRVRAPDPRRARFAHRHGVVHRDIKPHNVLVDARGPAEGDGLRHRARRGVADDRGRLDHRHGAVPLARAGARRAGRPALGPLLGRDRALRAADRHGAVHGDDAGRDRDEAPVRGARAAVEAAAGDPADLDLVVLRALAKDPDERYQTAEEMDADLARVARAGGLARDEEAATPILRGAGSRAPTMVARRRRRTPTAGAPGLCPTTSRAAAPADLAVAPRALCCSSRAGRRLLRLPADPGRAERAPDRSAVPIVMGREEARGRERPLDARPRSRRAARAERRGRGGIVFAQTRTPASGSTAGLRSTIFVSTGAADDDGADVRRRGRATTRSRRSLAPASRHDVHEVLRRAGRHRGRAGSRAGRAGRRGLDGADQRLEGPGAGRGAERRRQAVRARVELQGAGLRVARATSDSDQPAGIVVDQDPGRRTRASAKARR